MAEDKKILLSKSKPNCAGIKSIYYHGECKEVEPLPKKLIITHKGKVYLDNKYVGDLIESNDNSITYKRVSKNKHLNGLVMKIEF